MREKRSDRQTSVELSRTPRLCPAGQQFSQSDVGGQPGSRGGWDCASMKIPSAEFAVENAVNAHQQSV